MCWIRLITLVLFGIFSSDIIYFQAYLLSMASDLGIFNVSGGTLLTYGLWTRETDKKFSMNKVRAGVYALSIGLILFGLFTTAASGFTTGKVFTAPGVLMVFV